MIDYQELRERVAAARNSGEATLFFSIAYKSLGFTSMFLGEIPPDEKLMDDQMLHYDEADPWPEYYSSKRFRLVDPIIPMVKSLLYDVISWDMARQDLRKNNHAVRMYRDAERFNIFDALMFVRATQNKTIGYAHVLGPKDCDKALSDNDLLNLQRLANETIVKEASFSMVTETSRPLPDLTPRMLEVLHPVLEGWTNDAIATEYGTSAKAVENILAKIYDAFRIPDHPALNKRVVLCNRARKYDLNPIEPVLTKRPNYEIDSPPRKK